MSSDPLPSLIRTPSGLAVLEIQGTVHTSSASIQDAGLSSSVTESLQEPASHEIPLGRIVFPNYNPSLLGEEDQSWMKRVYLYVGQHQRLTGEVKKLTKPVAVLKKRERRLQTEEGPGIEGHEVSQTMEELEMVEVVKFKLLFAGRPEPVGE